MRKRPGFLNGRGARVAAVLLLLVGVALPAATPAAGMQPARNGVLEQEILQPSIHLVRIPEANGAGWNRTEVEVQTHCDGKNVVICEGPETPLRFTDEGATPVEETWCARDAAGQVACTEPFEVKIDWTPPEITANRPATNEAGWYSAPVTVGFDCTDGLSGVEACTAPVLLEQEGGGQAVTGMARDMAGNTAELAVQEINIDLNPPAWDGGALDAAAVGLRSITLSWPEAVDAASGVKAYQVYRDGNLLDTVAGTQYQATGLSPGHSYAFAVRAVDFAGHESPAGLTGALATRRLPPDPQPQPPDPELPVEPAPAPVLTGVEVEGPVQVAAGSTATYVALAVYANGDRQDADFVWQAQAGTMAAGVWIAPEAAGTYTLTASAGEKSGSLEVNVLPGPATVVRVIPERTAVQAGEVVDCTAEVTDAFGNLLPDARLVWNATGGTVTSEGIFTPDGSTPTAMVTVRLEGSDSVTGTAVINVELPVPQDANEPLIPPADMADHWALEPVLKLMGLGLVELTERGTFDPDVPAVRYDVAHLLSVAADLPVAEADLSVLAQFEDGGTVPPQYQYHVAAVVQARLIIGTDCCFDGWGLLTRAQMATIVGRILGGSEPEPLRYVDQDRIPSWAVEGVARASAARILVGYPDGTFRPDRPLTRAEMAQIVVRMLDYLAVY